MAAEGSRGWAVRPELLIVIAVVLAAVFFAASTLVFTGGHWLLPLDDSYIYLNYARHLADGHFFKFNLEDPPTSGSTSLLYPFLLAIGAVLGLDGAGLAFFAFCLGAVLATVLGLLLFRLLVQTLDPPVALLATATVVLSGPLMWGFFSGMEIAACAVAFVLCASSLSRELEEGRIRWSAAWLCLLALMRPEALVFVVLLVPALILVRRRVQPVFSGHWWLLVPLGVAALELVFLWALTGRPFPSTAPPKSPLFTPEFSIVFLLQHATNFFIQVFGSLLNGATELGSLSTLNGIDTTAFTPPFAILLFIFGSAPLVARELHDRKPRAHTLLTLWFLYGVVVIGIINGSGLHNFRYLHPYLLGFFVYLVPGARTLAAAALGSVGKVGVRALSFALVALVIFFQLLTLINFGLLFGQAARGFLPSKEVALWVRDNTPRNARIAALDVGMIGYYSDRYIFDIWGLVTPKTVQTTWYFADYAGSALEYIERLPAREQPQYFLAHRIRFDEHGEQGDLQPLRQNLVYRASTQSYAFPAVGVDLGLYAVQWPDPETANRPRTPALVREMESTGMQVVDRLDVADCESQRAHGYEVLADAPTVFPSNKIVAASCGELTVIEGTLGIPGGERFALRSPGPGPALLVHRTNYMPRPALVSVNGQSVGALRVQTVPGQWSEARLWIPADALQVGENHILVEGAYSSAHYWLLQR